jgi:hypothetical protein
MSQVCPETCTLHWAVFSFLHYRLKTGTCPAVIFTLTQSYEFTWIDTLCFFFPALGRTAFLARRFSYTGSCISLQSYYLLLSIWNDIFWTSCDCTIFFL